jgi:hypothetical protein
VVGESTFASQSLRSEAHPRRESGPNPQRTLVLVVVRFASSSAKTEENELITQLFSKKKVRKFVGVVQGRIRVVCSARKDRGTCDLNFAKI